MSRDGANWFPQPLPKNKPPASAATLLFGTFLVVVTGVGIVIALMHYGHTSHPAAGKTTSTTQVSTGPVDPRQAFNDCMRSAGAGGSSGFGGGRFGRRPSDKFRQAVEICRSILQGGPAATVPLIPPAKTTPAPPPVA